MTSVECGSSGRLVGYPNGGGDSETDPYGWSEPILCVVISTEVLVDCVLEKILGCLIPTIGSSFILWEISLIFIRSIQRSIIVVIGIFALRVTLLVVLSMVTWRPAGHCGSSVVAMHQSIITRSCWCLWASCENGNTLALRAATCCWILYNLSYSYAAVAEEEVQLLGSSTDSGYDHGNGAVVN